MNALARTIPPQSTVRVNEIRALASVRSQAAFVRALLDEVERVAPSTGECPLSVQLVEELARLGCRFIEVADALTATSDACVEEARAEIARCA